MTSTPPSPPPVDIAHPAHNPFDLPRAKQRTGLWVAIAVSAVIHVVIGVYLWNSKFTTKMVEYGDEKNDVQLVHPPAPPPPPPPPPPMENPATVMDINATAPTETKIRLRIYTSLSRQ